MDEKPTSPPSLKSQISGLRVAVGSIYRVRTRMPLSKLNSSNVVILILLRRGETSNVLVKSLISKPSRPDTLELKIACPTRKRGRSPPIMRATFLKMCSDRSLETQFLRLRRYSKSTGTASPLLPLISYSGLPRIPSRTASAEKSRAAMNPRISAVLTQLIS